MKFEGLQAELRQRVLGVAFAVSNELGTGFLESVYKEAMLLALKQEGLEARAEVPIQVSFRGTKIGQFYRNILVNGALLLELKVASEITKGNEAQLKHYLRATPIKVGLILAFDQRVTHRRLIFTNDRKPGLNRV